MNEQEKKDLTEQITNDPLRQIENLEVIQKETERKAQEREEELLIKIANQAEENRKARENEAKAQRAKEVAEHKYYNQQQA